MFPVAGWFLEPPKIPFVSDVIAFYQWVSFLEGLLIGLMAGFFFGLFVALVVTLLARK